MSRKHRAIHLSLWMLVWSLRRTTLCACFVLQELRSSLLFDVPYAAQKALIVRGYFDEAGDYARIFEGFWQLKDYNVLRASHDVLKATGLMAIIVWVGCGDSIQVHTDPGCYGLRVLQRCLSDDVLQFRISTVGCMPAGVCKLRTGSVQ